MYLNCWLMWLSLLLLTACFLPVAIRKVFALNGLVLCLSLLLSLCLSHCFYPICLFIQRSWALNHRYKHKDLALFHSRNNVHPFSLSYVSATNTETNKSHTHWHAQSFSSLALTASHTGICKRACVFHSSRLVHTGKGWQMKWLPCVTFSLIGPWKLQFVSRQDRFLYNKKPTPTHLFLPLFWPFYQRNAVTCPETKCNRTVQDVQYCQSVLPFVVATTNLIIF